MMERKEKSLSSLTSKLDMLFKITERGSTVGTEIKAGLGAFCIAVCALLMNTQIIGASYGNYAGAYFATAVCTFIGTFLLGMICNFPVLQTANMGISTMLIVLMGSNTGLTYENILFITFVAAIIYLVIVVTPLRKIFVDALPNGVKKALPVGIGLYVIYTALKNTGILTTEGNIASAADFTELNLFYFWLMAAGVLLVVIYTAAGRKNPLGSTYLVLILAMWVGGIVFFQEYFVGGQTATTLVYQRVNLIFATDGASPYNLVNGISSLKIGAFLKKGLDFSAFTEAGGNLALFVVESVMSFLFLGMYTNIGCFRASMAAGEMDCEEFTDKGEKKLLLVGAILNVTAPILGGTPTTVGVQSAAATKDGGKTGLSSLTAAVGFLIAACNWIFFAVFATSTNGVGMWINDTETKLAAYVKDSFIFADLIMIFAGIAMLRAIKNINTQNIEEMIPFAATLVGTVFLGDLVLGVAFGVILYCIIKLIRKERKTIQFGVIILAVIMFIYAFISLKYGGNFVTAVMTGGPGGMGAPF